MGNESYDPTAFYLIQRITPSTSASTIEFTSIPSTYKHLQIRYTAKDTYASGTASFSTANVRFNSDSGSNYTGHYFYGNGETVVSGGDTSASYLPRIYGSVYGSISSFATGIIDIFDYANTSKYKTVSGLFGVDFNNGTTNYGMLYGSGLYMSTSAVSSILFYPANTAFAVGTNFAIYGIKG